MKKLIILFAIVMSSTVCFAQSKVEVKKEGTTFVATKTASSYIPTEYSYRDTDGKTYQIYVHTTKKGETKCYIKKVSKKTGNEYWKEIPVKPEDIK